MKKIAILTFGIFLFISCQNNSEEQYQEEDTELEIMTVDSLPEAKWNGEYMKIVNEEDTKRTKRQSYGSDMYSMGTMKLFIENDTINFTTYERQKNVLTFTTSSIRAFVRSAFEEDVHFHFRKNNIVTKASGKYKADPSGKENNAVTMTVKARVNSEMKEYTLENGEVEILNFDPKLAKLKLKIKGTFKTINGESKKGTGEIDILFEEAFMTAG